MITSRQNALIKKLRSLSEKKFRDESGEFLIEGVKLVKEAISDGIEVEKIIATEKGAALFGETSIEVVLVDDGVYRSFSCEVSPQGVAAIAKKPNCGRVSSSGLSVFLDGVMDPSNVGAVLRSAAAAGYAEAYLANCADAFSPKALRASMGGAFKIRIVTGDRNELIKRVDVPLITADMGGVDVFDYRPPKSFCLVIGNEGNGVSAEVKSVASVTVSIPMDNSVESLNASVSAGILMYTLKYLRNQGE